eukprot:GHVR01090948.1.p1 GENE.GHVR01090948.1~~GHVR01090948.1.p1  ORF type:complete len:516 (-),score=82.14 GHVR01090948.1:126-1601(-)
MTILGIGVYIIVPYAFVNYNLELLVWVFIFVLFGMMLGLVLLALNIEQIIEHMVVIIFLFWETRVVRTLVLSNLISHRERNRKTSIMYTLSLGVIIFIFYFYSIEQNANASGSMRENGSVISLYSVHRKPREKHYLLFKYLNEIKNNGTIDEYSYTTGPLSSFEVGNSVITNLGQIVKFDVVVRGIAPNYFETTEPKFNVIDSLGSAEDSKEDIIRHLYTVRGSQCGVMSKSVKSEFLLDKDSSFLVYSEVPDYGNNCGSRLCGGGYYEMASGLTFSKVTPSDKDDLLLSIPSLMRLAGGCRGHRSARQMRVNRVTLKLSEKTLGDDKEMDKVVNALGDYGKVWDNRDSESASAESFNVINLIFLALTAVVMVLCFFSLIASMTANIVEHTKEMTVLRCIGFRKYRVILLFVYEAFALIISSSILGVIVGTVVGMMLLIQRIMLTGLPIPYTFPYSLILIVIACAAVSAIGSTVFPAWKLIKLKIAVLARK